MGRQAGRGTRAPRPALPGEAHDGEAGKVGGFGGEAPPLSRARVCVGVHTRVSGCACVCRTFSASPPTSHLPLVPGRREAAGTENRGWLIARWPTTHLPRPNTCAPRCPCAHVPGHGGQGSVTRCCPMPAAAPHAGHTYCASTFLVVHAPRRSSAGLFNKSPPPLLAGFGRRCHLCFVPWVLLVLGSGLLLGLCPCDGGSVLICGLFRERSHLEFAGS